MKDQDTPENKFPHNRRGAPIGTTCGECPCQEHTGERETGRDRQTPRKKDGGAQIKTVMRNETCLLQDVHVEREGARPRPHRVGQRAAVEERRSVVARSR